MFIPFFRIHIFQNPDFSGSIVFWVQVFRFQLFNGADFSESGSKLAGSGSKARVWVQVLGVAKMF